MIKEENDVLKGKLSEVVPKKGMTHREAEKMGFANGKEVDGLDYAVLKKANKFMTEEVL